MSDNELERLNDQGLIELERKIHKLYKEAVRDMDKTITDYFQKFAKRDKEMKTALEDGEITKKQYTEWRLTQIGRGNRFEALRDKLAERMTKANEVAVAYVNDTTPGVYTLNMNYTAYDIERKYGAVDFTAWNDESVRRLVLTEPDLMPYYPPERALNRGLDLDYGKRQITAQITSSILLGDSIPNIARKLQSRLETMNRTSAIRTARTAYTAAQNGGRQASYERAADLGIKVRKRWSAVKDKRTRFDHGSADGQVVDFDKPFVVGGEKLMFPGDGSMGASAGNLYNCRCRSNTVEKEGIEAEPKMIRVRDPETGKNVLVKDMTYAEWYKWKTGQDYTRANVKKGLASSGNNAIMAVAGNNNPRNKALEASIKRSIKAETPVFSDGSLARNAKNIKPIPNFFDTVMHGTPKDIELFGEKASPQILANVLNAREDYSGQNVRLLSCSTGLIDDNGGCFAKTLANILGVSVMAPNGKLWVHPDGKLTIGERRTDNDGEFVVFEPK